MDQLFADWMSRIIESARKKQPDFGPAKLINDGKLRLLFAGYNGTRNTGSDVRVEEMLRQFRQLFGANRVESTVFSLIPSYSAGYFGDARKITPGGLFPRLLAREVPQHDGVIACEGSMFKSKFTDMLTIMMVGALGLATAHNKLSIAYGAEAGDMNPASRRLTSQYCRESLVITRNEESRNVLSELGVPSELGTDTAWTFSPLGNDYAQQELRKAGWTGQKVLVVCPMNPFWWPVKPSLTKLIPRLFGFNRRSHYGSIFFFNWTAEVRRKFEQYLTAMANAVDSFRRRTGAFVILAASEELDNHAMESLSEKLGGVPMFSSSRYNMYQLVSIFRSADMMLSSRYHAIVTSMAGKVASAGVTIDERIANLMKDRGHEHLLMRVDDPDLESRVETALDHLHEYTESVADTASKTVVKHLHMMSQMGKRLVEYVGEKYPNFEITQRFNSWEDFLPPMGGELQELLNTHSESPTFAWRSSKYLPSQRAGLPVRHV